MDENQQYEEGSAEAEALKASQAAVTEARDTLVEGLSGLTSNEAYGISEVGPIEANEFGITLRDGRQFVATVEGI